VTSFEVCVDVATMWTSPAAPRPVDAPAVADDPDISAWTTALDPAARLGLHGRTLSQLVLGEPVDVVAEGPAGWVQVAAPWQPAPEDPRGYLGWLRSAHLARSAGARRTVPPADVRPGPSAAVDTARGHIGLRYLWGGTSGWGFDCSGLVHHCLRRTGLVVPRDAYAQHSAARPVPQGKEQPGDLYFFAQNGRVNHVGFVTAPGRMVHAPEDSDAGPGEGRIEEAPLSAAREATLTGAGRFSVPD
jgi:gamma-D-glutamyl-L-lysine dipeptidyl-peptidase